MGPGKQRTMRTVGECSRAQPSRHSSPAPYPSAPLPCPPVHISYYSHYLVLFAQLWWRHAANAGPQDGPAGFQHAAQGWATPSHPPAGPPILWTRSIVLMIQLKSNTTVQWSVERVLSHPVGHGHPWAHEHPAW